MAEDDDRPGHVGVALLVERDSVALRQPEQVRDALRVDDIVRVNLGAHATGAYKG